MVGRYPVAPGEVFAYLGHLAGFGDLDAQRTALLHNLIVEIRLPRVLVGLMVGAALSVSGAAFQGVFRNPLVSPGLLGALAGASAGAAAAMLLDAPWWAVQSSAFLTGVVAVVLALCIARIFADVSLVTLVLGGIVSGALFTSLLSIAKYVADPYNQLPAIVYWLMGNLGQASLGEVGVAALPIAVGTLALCFLGRALDALTMGDEEAASLGVPVQALRLSVIALATLVSALTVSLAGMIGWIGLIVPHVARLIVGPRNALVLPVSACIGATFLVAADTFSRELFAAEVPIGIVTELLGIPFFLIVLARVRRSWVA
jgi:iron complex transport system permease protein